MTQSTPTVTLHIPASQMSVVLARLTAFLLHARYAFLQTFHSAGHTDIDMFDQHQQLLVRCTLRVAAAPVSTPRESPAPGTLVLSPQSSAISPPLMSLLRELAQVCATTAEN